MRRQMYAEYANFHLTFGDFELLDFANQIVIPAFIPAGQSRSYGNDVHIFRDVQMLNYGTTTLNDADQPLLVIAGRYIKLTHLVSEQKYDIKTETLEQREEVIEDAPSSLFILVLNNHRLIYVKETAGAPGLEAFQTTCSRFLKIAYDAYIELVLTERRLSNPGRRITRASIMREIPKPLLSIVPIGDAETFSRYVDLFHIVKSLDIRLIKPNHEPDFVGFVKELRTTNDALGGNPNSATAHIGDPKGLNKERLKEQLVDAAQDANSELTLRGIAANGSPINGTPEKYEVKTSINIPDRSVVAATRHILSSTIGVLKSLVRGKKSDSGNTQNIKNIERRFDQAQLENHVEDSKT